MSMLVRVGTTDLYTDPPISDIPGDTLFSAFDGMLLSEILPIETNSKVLNADTIQEDHYVDGRATCGFAVYDPNAEFEFAERQLVRIMDLDHVNEFAGLVQSAKSFEIPGTGQLIHAIEACDLSSMLDWRLVDYASTDKLAGDAVREIMQEYLTEEGIAEGYIEDGQLLSEIRISDKTANEAYTKLAEACGFVFYVDYDLKLYFHNRTVYAAPWSITDGADILVDTFQITRSNANYRNSETVIGGYEETDAQTEQFKGDGVAKSFPLAYPCNRVITVTTDGVANTVGQKGTDSGEYDCYYAVNSETLAFENAPASNAIIEIVYHGLWRAKSKAEDYSAQTANKDRQGVGSGKIEHVSSDESLTSILAAGEYANAKLADYGVDGIQIEYKTRRAGLAAGTLQHVTYLGLDHDFLITHVSVTHQDGDTEYMITGVSGPIQEEWDLFLNHSFEAVNQISEGVSEGQSVAKLYNFQHTYYGSDRPDPFGSTPVGSGLAMNDDSWPSFDPLDRAEYIEFWRGNHCHFRKAHTRVPDEENNSAYHSFSYIGPNDALGDIEEVVFYGGASATIEYGSGVELYRTDFLKTKTPLESYQVNMTYINGDV